MAVQLADFSRDICLHFETTLGKITVFFDAKFESLQKIVEDLSLKVDLLAAKCNKLASVNQD